MESPLMSAADARAKSIANHACSCAPEMEWLANIIKLAADRGNFAVAVSLKNLNVIGPELISAGYTYIDYSYDEIVKIGLTTVYQNGTLYYFGDLCPERNQDIIISWSE